MNNAISLAFSFAATHGNTKASPVQVCDRVQLSSGEQFVVTATHDKDGEEMIGADDRPVYLAVSKTTGFERVILAREVKVHYKRSA